MNIDFVKTSKYLRKNNFSNIKYILYSSGVTSGGAEGAVFFWFLPFWCNSLTVDQWRRQGRD